MSGATIDLLELQMLYEYNLYTMNNHPTATVYPYEYNLNAGALTELKKVQCCRKCHVAGRRRYTSNAERIFAVKMKILTCGPEYDCHS